MADAGWALAPRSAYRKELLGGIIPLRPNAIQFYAERVRTGIAADCAVPLTIVPCNTNIEVVHALLRMRF